MLIRFGQLDKQTCNKHLVTLLDVHSDVADWTDENLLLDLPEKWDLSIVGYCGKPICYAIQSTKWNNRVHIHHFMVHRDYRNQGVGARLLARVKERAFTRKNLLSLNVARTNHRAMTFYERQGFSLDKYEDQQYWFIMRR